MGCRCEACTRVACDYALRYYYSHKSPKKTGTALCIFHIRFLQQHGLGYVAIGEAADMSPATVMRIHNGQLKTVLISTEKRLLNVTPDAIKDGALVPLSPTKERLAELREEGFTCKQIAAALGASDIHFLKNKSENVTARTEMRIRKLHITAMRDASGLRRFA